MMESKHDHLIDPLIPLPPFLFYHLDIPAQKLPSQPNDHDHLINQSYPTGVFFFPLSIAHQRACESEEQ